MVVVEFAAFLVRQLVVALIVAVVVDHAHFVGAELFPQPRRQGAFSAAGTAGNADDGGFHSQTSLLFIP